MKSHLCALLALLLLLAALLPAHAADFDFSGLTLDELYAARDQLEQQIAALEGQSGIALYESGSYRVGSDIPAGDYVLYENDGAVFASAVIRTGDSEDADLVTYHIINRQAVIHLSAGTWLTLSEARACPLSQAQPVEDGFAGEGGYLVGATLPAGRYTAVMLDGAPLSSYSVYDGILDTGAQLIKFEVLHEEAVITLEDGEYIELSGCGLGPSPEPIL